MWHVHLNWTAVHSATAEAVTSDPSNIKRLCFFLKNINHEHLFVVVRCRSLRVRGSVRKSGQWTSVSSHRL